MGTSMVGSRTGPRDGYSSGFVEQSLTNFEPFLPPVPPSSVSPILIALLSPLSALQVAVRIPLLSVLAALHFLLQAIAVVFVCALPASQS